MSYVAEGSRPRALAALCGLIATALALALAPGTALAGKGVVAVIGASGSGAGQFASAVGTAVNATTGDIYVVDQGNDRIEQFDASGSFVRTWGWGVSDGNATFEVCTSACQTGQAGTGDGQFDGPQGLAIDQSDGSVYVVDGNNSRVEKFDAAGSFVSQFGTAGSAEAQLSGPQGIAIDPTDGSIYVVDAGNNRVEKFDHTRAFVNTFGAGVADGSDTFEVCTSSCQTGIADSGDGAFNFPTRVAVDSTGQVYVLDFGNGRVERFTSADAFDEQFDQTDVNPGTGPAEIAIGPGNDHLYVAQAAPDFSEQRVFEIDAAGTLVDTHGVGSTAGNVSGLALSAGSQRIYLADGGNARVLVLDDIASPTVAIDPAFNVTSNGASLSGSVTPNGSPPVGWHFEISTDGVNFSAIPPDHDAGSGNAAVPVSQNLTGLVPNTTYFVRLAATRPFNAATDSSAVQLSTPAIVPDVTTDPAKDIAPDHATLAGRINPNNSATTFRFEYGTTAAYGASLPATQDGDAGSADAVEAEIQAIYNLQPNTTYHYRLVATNSVDTVRGADQTFTTTNEPPTSAQRHGIPGTGFLPDNRAWEQVSPVDKNGSDVMGDSARTRAASDGSATTFSSLGAFADAHGTGVASDYMSVRDGQPGTSGWTTHALTPRQDPLTFAAVAFSLDPLYEGEFSPDLSQGVFRAWSPLTNEPNVAQVENLYARSDLRTAGAGSYQLLTDCPACGATPLPPIVDTTPMPRLAGASSDFSHVIFESTQALTADAPAQTPRCIDGSRPNQCRPRLYESDHGTVRLVGILPDGSVAASSAAGEGASRQRYTPHTISEDGSRIVFTDNSETGGGQSGVLYMRVDHSTTVQINASERAQPDPNGSAPATFYTASSDGSHVFFTTSEQLTDDDHTGANDLYMYDANAPAGSRLTRLSVDNEPADPPGDVSGVIGASANGRYVYFIATGQLVAGEPSLLGSQHGIYEWHDGVISYVGALLPGDPDVDQDVVGTNIWALTPLSARVTPDGTHLVFTARDGTDLTGYNQGSCLGVGNEGCSEVYVYSANTHALRCASCNPTGAPATVDASINIRTDATSGSGTTWHLSHAVSEDGRHVFFSTAEALVPEDSNGKSDAYEYDTDTGTVHLLSSGKDPGDSWFMDASSDGDDAFFATRQQLVGWDDDQNYDLYDTRVDGGLPDPAPVPPACSGEGCQPSSGGTPSASAPGSTGWAGPGNVASPTHKTSPKPVKCKRGFVRKKVKGKVRCVKRKKAKKVKHKPRKAKQTKQAGKVKNPRLSASRRSGR